MSTVAQQRFKRPIPVTLVGFIALGVAGFHFYQGADWLWRASGLWQDFPASLQNLNAEELHFFFRSVLKVGLSFLALVILFNFFRLRRWSWLALTLWITVYMIVDLFTYLYAQANFLSMAINSLLTFLLIQSDVQLAFGLLSTEKAQDDHP
ncbi:MAG: hypothetical protein ACP5QU_06305 [Anaerolineae bacterium]